MRGKLIVFEGIDACGKATQSDRLTRRRNARLWSFPTYETVTGQAILSNLQQLWAPSVKHNPENLSATLQFLDALVRQSLFAVNRHEHAGTIERSLAAGQDVVCDRYWPSGYVFGIADGLDGDWLIRIHERLPQPDCFLLLDISPEVSIQRRLERRDRYEKDDKAAIRRAMYLTLFKRQALRGEPWHIIDGSGTVEEVERSIWLKLADTFGVDFNSTNTNLAPL
jgi:dTMP kinase